MEILHCLFQNRSDTSMLRVHLFSLFTIKTLLPFGIAIYSYLLQIKTNNDKFQRVPLIGKGTSCKTSFNLPTLIVPLGLN